MTTFIDFRYLRALAAALFTGQEKEELEIILQREHDNYLVLDLGTGKHARILASFESTDSTPMATIECDHEGTISVSDRQGKTIITLRAEAGKAPLVGMRLNGQVTGLKIAGSRTEVPQDIFGKEQGGAASLRLNCADGVRVMGQGSGRAMHWGKLFYLRGDPTGLCVELTMDWHHLRAGIPLFGTMTAEQLVAEGKYRLRFRSYAYEELEAGATDFVRLFTCEDPADIAVHLTPSFYTPNTPDIPNLAFGVVESERIHPYIVKCFNTMDRVVVPSTFVRDAFVGNGVTCPIDVVLHGVETDYFRPAETRRPLPGGRSFNFLAVGTQVERKNIRHLVRAFLEEFREDEDVALFLLIRPEFHTTQNNVVLDFSDWEQEWALDSAKIFIWTGYLTRGHLRDFYANANAYVMPSNEGFGLTLLEAMSCGTPTIGLNHGGVLDFLHPENSVLVETGKSFVARDIDTMPYVGDHFYAPDISGLRAAMRRMFQDPVGAARLGARARADAEQLSWEEVTRRFSEVIEHTHADFHARTSTGLHQDRSTSAAGKITLVLCVLDDKNVLKSLDYLRGMADSHFNVLCLFTRYARLQDVLRARDYGFVNYRWDGTLDNCKMIARTIFGQHWILVLNPDEKMVSDAETLEQVIESQAPEIAEVSVVCANTRLEPRLFHLRPPGVVSEHAQSTNITIR